MAVTPIRANQSIQSVIQDKMGAWTREESKTDEGFIRDTTRGNSAYRYGMSGHDIYTQGHMYPEGSGKYMYDGTVGGMA